MLSHNELIDIGKQTIATEIDGLKQLENTLGGDFAAVVQAMYDCKGRIIISGIGKSAHIGNKIAATLSSTGTPAHFLHAAEAAHGDLGVIDKNDVVIIISNSGESSEISPIVLFCRRYGVTLVALTANSESSLATLSDYCLLMPKAEEACPLLLAPMTSTTLTLVYGDALAAALLKLRGFKKEDFARFHPGGKLGARLLRLRELLEKDKSLLNVPAVALDASISEVVVAITNGRRGMVAVKNADTTTAGVITDGDLRRALPDMDMKTAIASDLMNANPIKISDRVLVVDVVAKCEETKVNALFVTGDDNRIKGLVHIQDLLASGAV